jgi:Uma2 family endonuclease
MTVAKSPLFRSFEDYLAADPSDLPEGRFEYWDGELVPVMSESELNDDIANALYFVLRSAGIWSKLIRPHSCEVEVPGQPRTRLPDLTILDEVHVPLIARRTTITRKMPPPRLLAEVVSPGSETSANYKRDYEDKPKQYAAIGVLEYWIIDPDDLRSVEDHRAVVLVGTLQDGAYQFQTCRGDMPIGSATFPDLVLTAAQVLNAGEI